MKYDLHGWSRTRIYKLWHGMKSRCQDKNNSAYHRYGGRGITVCKRWQKFMNFLKDMGLPPDGHQLDRIDNNGAYSPENCRWATPLEQGQNQRTNRLITYDGQTKTVAAWARETGIHSTSITGRIKSGWPIEAALTVKPGTYKRGKFLGEK